MPAVRFLTDENVYKAVGSSLRKAGVDAISTPDAGRLGASDLSQLLYAADGGGTIVTFNVAHFAQLHTEWIDSGRHHAGIVVSVQRPIGEDTLRLKHLAMALSAEKMKDRLEYLGDW